jgi:ADP-heptose:LPS heptosyltransferase
LNELNDESCALIIQPGALGDCLLTLPLARLIKSQLQISHLDIMGHQQYLSFLLERTDFRQVISLDTLDLHSLFIDPADFDPTEDDPLIELFRPYELIVTFLSDPERHFESNLVYTSCITHTAEVITLELHPPDNYPDHAAHFFLNQLRQQLPQSQIIIDNDFTKGPTLQSLPLDHKLGQDILKKTHLSLEKPLIALHPGSGGEYKCWPLNNFQNLAFFLTQQGYQSLFLAGPVEQDRWEASILNQLARKHCLLSNLDLNQLISVLTCCQAYVGNDSGITHLAAALNLPTLAIFGPTNPRNWQPLGEKIRICRAKNSPQKNWPEAPTVLKALQQLI